MSLRAVGSKSVVGKNVSDASGRFVVAVPLQYKAKEMVATASADGYINLSRHIVVSVSYLIFTS